MKNYPILIYFSAIIGMAASQLPANRELLFECDDAYLVPRPPIVHYKHPDKHPGHRRPQSGGTCSKDPFERCAPRLEWSVRSWEKFMEEATPVGVAPTPQAAKRP